MFPVLPENTPEFENRSSISQNWNRRKPRASKTLGLNCSVLQFKEFRFQCFAKWKHFEIRNFTTTKNKTSLFNTRTTFLCFALLPFKNTKNTFASRKKRFSHSKLEFKALGKWRKTLELSKAMNLDSEYTSRKQFSLSFLFLFASKSEISWCVQTVGSYGESITGFLFLFQNRRGFR